MITSATLQHNDMNNIKHWPESILVVFSRQTCNLTRHALWVNKKQKIPSFVVVTVAVIVVAVDNKEKGLLSVGQL